jgi:hypothetical protein
MKDTYWNDLVNFARVVEFSEQYLRCNGLCAYCMGASSVANVSTFASEMSEYNAERQALTPPRLLFRFYG